jgi:drug/metabolite transporter (DMT)-like permease
MFNRQRLFQIFESHQASVMLAMGAAFGFALKAIFVKLAYPYGVSPVALLALRMIFSAPVFLWVAIREHRNSRQENHPAISPKSWLLLACVGIAGYYGSSIMDFFGLQYISVGLERLILYTYPTLAVIAGIAFTGQRWSRRIGIALVLTYLGIALAFIHDLGTLPDTTGVIIGSLLVFGSSIAYATYLTVGGPLIRKLGPVRFTALALLASTIAVLAHFLATQPLSSLRQPWQVYAYGLGMAAFATVIPIFMQSLAIRRLGSGEAALIGTTGAMFTIILGWIVLGDPWSVWQMVGTVLVMAGVWYQSQGRR